MKKGGVVATPPFSTLKKLTHYIILHIPNYLKIEKYYLLFLTKKPTFLNFTLQSYELFSPDAIFCV